MGPETDKVIADKEKVLSFIKSETKLYMFIYSSVGKHAERNAMPPA